MITETSFKDRPESLASVWFNTSDGHLYTWCEDTYEWTIGASKSFQKAWEHSLELTRQEFKPKYLNNIS